MSLFLIFIFFFLQDQDFTTITFDFSSALHWPQITSIEAYLRPNRWIELEESEENIQFDLTTINNFFLGFCGRFSFFRWIDLSFKQSRNESCDLRIVWWIEKAFGESINRSLEGIKSNSNKCFSFTKRFSVQFWFGMRKSTKSCL